MSSNDWDRDQDREEQYPSRESKERAAELQSAERNQEDVGNDVDQIIAQNSDVQSRMGANAWKPWILSLVASLFIHLITGGWLSAVIGCVGVHTLWVLYAPLLNYKPLKPPRKPAHVDPKVVRIPSGWFKICDSSDLPPGALRSITLGGQEVVAFRTRAGDAPVVCDAYCPHLGAHLGREIDSSDINIENANCCSKMMPGAGSSARPRLLLSNPRVHCDTNCLECPFHGWRFDASTGKCISTATAAAPPSLATLKLWRVCETAASVLVWYPRTQEPTWSPFDTPDFPRVLDDASQTYYVGKTEQWVQCRISDVPENGADLLHVNFVHYPSVVPLMPMVQHVYTGEWHCQPKDGPLWFQAQVDIDAWIRMYGHDFKSMVIKNRIVQIGPGLVYFNFRPCMGLGCFKFKGSLHLLYALTPVTNNLNRIQHLAYADHTLPHWFAKWMLWGLCEQVDRDLAVFQTKKHWPNPILCRAEKPMAEFRRWFQQFFRSRGKVAVAVDHEDEQQSKTD